MWPWGHLAVGYMLYSLSQRVLTSERITGREAVVLAVATQLPDLVDKPLAWSFSVFSSGYAIGHSVFVAVPVGIAALVVAFRRDRLGLGLAVTVGYWSHLFADVMLAVVFGNRYTVSRVLWPAVALPGSNSRLGTFEQVRYYFGEFLELLAAGNPVVFIVFFGPLLLAAALWIVDGAPVARELYEWVVDPR
jgi:hypothetical protein